MGSVITLISLMFNAVTSVAFIYGKGKGRGRKPDVSPITKIAAAGITVSFAIFGLLFGLLYLFKK